MPPGHVGGNGKTSEIFLLKLLPKPCKIIARIGAGEITRFGFREIEVFAGDGLKFACYDEGNETSKDRIYYALEQPERLPGGHDIPEWFRLFYKQYQKNENQKILLLRQMHLEMIDYEISKCVLLLDVIRKLND